MDENGNPYTPVTRESVIAEYNEEQKAACEAWNVEMLTDIFPQPDEFETPPYSHFGHMRHRRRLRAMWKF